MYLFYGVVCFSLFFMLGAVALLVSRNPVPPRWAGDFFIQDFVVPGVIGLFILGVCLVIKYATAFPGWGSAMKTIGTSAGVAALTVVVLRLMKVREKLARYAEQDRRGRVISFPEGKEIQKPEPPASPIRPVADKKAA